MKKLITLMMVVSLLLGCAACNPFKTTKGKLSDEPINCYKMDHSVYRRSYGAPQSEPDNRGIILMSNVILWLESVKFEDALLKDPNRTSFQEIQNQLDKHCEEIKEEYESAYQKAVEDFADREKKGLELPDGYWYSEVSVYRADDVVTSVFFDTYSRGINSDDKDMGANYRTSDASLIHFDDVVTDRDAIRKYVKMLEPSWYEDLLDDLDKDDPVFTIAYDGIFFPQYSFKVPAYGLMETAFDLSYFSRVPDNYMLKMNNDHTLTWFFDGNGSKTKFTYECDYTSNPTHTILTLGNKEYILTEKDIPSLEIAFTAVPLYVVFSGAKKYFVMHDIINYYIELQSETINEVASNKPFITEWYNTNAVRGEYRRAVIGETRIYQEFKLNGGIPESPGGWCEANTAVMQVMKDLPGKEFDCQTRSIGAETTLETGKTVHVVLFNEDTEQVVVRVLDPDESQVRYILLETDLKNTRVAGKDPYDCFYNIKKYN